MLDMIRAEEARQLVAASEPDRDMAANDTLSDDAMDWAFQNAIGRTEMRIKTYALWPHAGPRQVRPRRHRLRRRRELLLQRFSGQLQRHRGRRHRRHHLWP